MQDAAQRSRAFPAPRGEKAPRGGRVAAAGEKRIAKTEFGWGHDEGEQTEHPASAPSKPWAKKNGEFRLSIASPAFPPVLSF